MGESGGHFERGAWVEDKDEGPANAAADIRAEVDPMEKRVREVSSLVSTSFSELIALARDLIATPEGQAHIRSRLEGVSSEIERALSDILGDKGEKRRD
jgi:archaellum component FlaC